MINIVQAGGEMIWGETSGPGAHDTLRMAHEQFDRLADIEPAKRSRGDRLSLSLLTTVESWLDDSGADELVQWSHTYLAHAGDPTRRAGIVHATATTNKIANAIRSLARVTQAISAEILFAGGRTSSLVPVAQFDKFEKLDNPVMKPGDDVAAEALWDALSADRDRYLDEVEAELTKRATPGISAA